MKTATRTKESTNLLFPISPERITTLMGIDFDVSGYVRKVELLNDGSGIDSHTHREKSGIETRRKVVS